ncbi:MAG: penicillin acylase family protein, partial [Chitinophagales bacterium]|nr:penicillin acylase family protein [Chitinophagales bacterium]
MSKASDLIGDAIGGKFDKIPVNFNSDPSLGPVGSNAFALAPSRTTDGNTYLCINPHMFMEGQLSFYEAHLSSAEG